MWIRHHHGFPHLNIQGSYDTIQCLTDAVDSKFNTMNQSMFPQYYSSQLNSVLNLQQTLHSALRLILKSKPQKHDQKLKLIKVKTK